MPRADATSVATQPLPRKLFVALRDLAGSHRRQSSMADTAVHFDEFVRDTPLTGVLTAHAIPALPTAELSTANRLE